MTFTDLRRLLSFLAAAVALRICIVQGHVHVVLYELNTYASLFHHRCGLLLVICFTWAAVETAWVCCSMLMRKSARNSYVKMQLRIPKNDR